MVYRPPKDARLRTGFSMETFCLFLMRRYYTILYMSKDSKITLIVVFAVIGVLVLLGIIFKPLRSLRDKPAVDKPTTSISNDFNVGYGKDKNQIYDFYAPEQKVDTLIVIVHGGAWVLGNKTQFNDMSKFFAGKGYSVININYRLAPKWKHPTQLEDIATILDLVKKNPAKFNLKNDYKVALMGHSAGGHLVSLFGLKEDDFGATDVTYVVSLAGPTDITASTFTSRDATGKGFYSFLGDTPIADVNPTLQVPENEKTKYLLLLGDKDEFVEPYHLENFEKALKDKGATVYSWLIPGLTHNSLIEGIPNDSAVAEAILKFL